MVNVNVHYFPQMDASKIENRGSWGYEQTRIVVAGLGRKFNVAAKVLETDAPYSLSRFQKKGFFGLGRQGLIAMPDATGKKVRYVVNANSLRIRFNIPKKIIDEAFKKGGDLTQIFESHALYELGCASLRRNDLEKAKACFQKASQHHQKSLEKLELFELPLDALVTKRLSPDSFTREKCYYDLISFNAEERCYYPLMEAAASKADKEVIQKLEIMAAASPLLNENTDKKIKIWREKKLYEIPNLALSMAYRHKGMNERANQYLEKVAKSLYGVMLRVKELIQHLEIDIEALLHAEGAGLIAYSVYLLSRTHEKLSKNIFFNVKFESAQDFGMANNFLGDMHLFGLGGCKSDPKKAERYFLQSALANDGYALVKLVALYRMGKGKVSQNLQKAEEWLEKLTQQSPNFLLMLSLIHKTKGDFFLENEAEALFKKFLDKKLEGKSLEELKKEGLEDICGFDLLLKNLDFPSQKYFRNHKEEFSRLVKNYQVRAYQYLLEKYPGDPIFKAALENIQKIRLINREAWSF